MNVDRDNVGRIRYVMSLVYEECLVIYSIYACMLFGIVHIIC